MLLQVELTTLKTNNARLTSALQESTANVDEWKRQLQLYKEENAKIKLKYADLEAGKIAEGNSEALRLRVEALESELRTRNEEIKALTMATKNKDFMVCTQSLLEHLIIDILVDVFIKLYLIDKYFFLLLQGFTKGECRTSRDVECSS